MEQQAALAMLSDLSCAPGVSGFEDETLRVIRAYGAGLGAFTEDSMRNLYLEREDSGGDKPRLLLDAHTDEVGFMVKGVQANGLLAFHPIGGWVAGNVGAHKVKVRNRDGAYVSGVISTKPPHYMSEAERKAPPDLASMLIDVGAGCAEEVSRDFKIGVGAPVVPDAAFECGANGVMCGKAFDDRLGCGAVLAALGALRGESLGVSVTAAFAAQEEVGLRGARVTANTVKPCAAVCFEGAPADDTFAAAPQTRLGSGPMLRYMDNAMITNPRFQRFALDTAARHGIPVQEAVRTGGSTNAGAIHLAAQAVPVIVISIPVRYAHTHYGMAAYRDFENAVKLGIAIIRGLTREVIEGF